MRQDKSSGFSELKWCPETELNRRHADFQSYGIPFIFNRSW